MKPNLKTLIAGLAIILVTNAIALAGVAYNRSGEPDAMLELTERELGLPYRYGMQDENTGLSLRINCRLEANDNAYIDGITNCIGNPNWLNQDKLRDLGFTLKTREDANTGYYRADSILPREVYLVLEYDGATYQRVLAGKQKYLSDQQALLTTNPGNKEFEQRVKNAHEALAFEQTNSSRLFAIDAGLDKGTLRQTYPDTSRYILMRATIRPIWDGRDKNEPWTGYIDDLLIDTINIPLAHRAVFEPLEEGSLQRDPTEQTPRYKVRVAFGKRLEPWVMGVEGM